MTVTLNLNSIGMIGMICSAVVIVLTGVWAFISIRKEDFPGAAEGIAEKAMYINVVGIIIGVIAAFIFAFTIPTPEEEISERLHYEAYLDGEKVDIDKLDLSFYKITYDDEKNIIYLTRKGN